MFVIDTNTTLYVSKSGSDANGGTSWTDAKLTIGSAVTAAVNYDTILVGPGQFDENIDLSALTGIRLVGSGWRSTQLRDTGGSVAPLIGGDGMVLADLTVEQTVDVSGVPAVDINGLSDVRLERCVLLGRFDGFQGDETIGLVVDDCRVAGTFDGARMPGADRYLIRNSSFFTDQSWPQDTPAAQGFSKARALLQTQDADVPDRRMTGLVTNCLFEVDSVIATEEEVVAAEFFNNPTVVNCAFRARATKSGDGVIGVRLGSLSEDELPYMANCSVDASNDGAGNAQSIVSSASSSRVSGVGFDRGLASGTILDVTPNFINTASGAAAVGGRRR